MPEDNQQNGGDQNSGEPPKTFTQADLDRIVTERLQRERSKFQDYDDLKKKAGELESLQEQSRSEQEKAIANARKETEQQVRTEERGRAGARLVQAELRTLLTGRMPDDARDALAESVNHGAYLTADGGADTEKLKAYVEKVAPSPAGPPTTKGPPSHGQGGKPATGTSQWEEGRARAQARFGKQE